jgi:TonB family protein
MSCPDPYRPNDPLAETDPDADLKIRHLLPSNDEVRTLTGTLAASGGGSSSKDLALDLVLNQIVEQACLATGATGAAIALLRDGEMVCRATTGRTAPDLGMRLDNAGFSAECLRIGTLQRCDDTETDPRVDPVACRLLGVRSILVVPLWYWGEFMGIFEIFSPRPNAFGERDEQTLQALAYRIVRQAKQANGMITGFPEETAQIPPPPPPRTPASPPPDPTPIRIVESEPLRTTGEPIPVYELTPAKPAQERPDLWTMALAGCAILIACAIVGLMIWRVGWTGDEVKKVAAAPQTIKTVAPATQPSEAASTPQEEILELGTPGAPPPSPRAKAPSAAGNVVVSAATKTEVPLPPSDAVTSNQGGGLAIYDQDGKLIYGKPIADADQSIAPKAAKSEVKPPVSAKLTAPSPVTSSTTKGRYLQLSSDAADALLTNRIEPEYPDAARRAHIQGTVTVDTVVGSDGKVLNANAISGSPQLVDAATAAVRQWHYKPHVVNGKKVPFRTQVPVTFMLPQ